MFIYFLCNVIGTDFFMNIMRLLNYYLGFLLYGVIISFIYWIIYLLFSLFNLQYFLASKVIGIVLIIIFLLINIIAIYNFEKGIHIEEFIIDTDKVKNNYTFVHIADTQLGSISPKDFKNVFDLALKQKPDFIVFTGDIVDNNNYKKEDFDFLKEIKIPIYFERGNHEFYHNPEKLNSILKNISSIIPLYNKQTNFQDIQIVGIEYSRKKYNLRDNLKNIKLNNSKYSILLYHEPKEIETGVKKGFDLILSGHTHGGQIFPFTKVVGLIYKYANGFYDLGSTKVYTTNGAGLFGPKMRLGSRNEIAVFKIKKK